MSLRTPMYIYADLVTGDLHNAVLRVQVCVGVATRSTIKGSFVSGVAGPLEDVLSGSIRICVKQMFQDVFF